MTRRHITLLVIIAIPVTLVYCFSLRAEPPRNPRQAEDLFSGKILGLVQRMNPNSAITLEEVRLTRLGEQPFLVGKGVDEAKGWTNGRTVWVPLAEVSQIAEFTDRSDLIKASESQRSGK
ncbi:MAG TPA: hypothetical protein VEI07_05660 [Planctomycetaceae bacterium]|nr:hypothetical protein [Planctomycetaceae bacterium]